MILQALNDYYLRKEAIDPGSLPPLGFQNTAISYIVVLYPDGRPHSIQPNFEAVAYYAKGGKEKTRDVPREHKTPMAWDRPGQNSWETAFLLWDHPRYVLGIPKDDSQKEKKLAPLRLGVFVERIKKAFSDETELPLDIKTVINFYESNGLDILRNKEHWKECSEGYGNISFKLIGSSNLVCELPIVQKIAKKELEESGIGAMLCLVTGELRSISGLHMATPLRTSSQATAKLVSYNEAAYRSYGKQKGDNAPVSTIAAFQYCTALNDLLTRSHIVAGTEIVYWATKPETDVEVAFSFIVGLTAHSDTPDNKRIEAVKRLMQSPVTGILNISEDDDKFYVLGLSPSAARISVQIWHVAAIKHFSRYIVSWFQDMEIDFPVYEHRHFLPLNELLKSIALLGEAKNIPPNIAGETLRAIVSGLPLPAALLNMAVIRCRAERQVTPPRASLIKACLNRQARLNHQPENALTMSLNPEDTRPAYRLGRLFAALERIQYDAMGELNSNVCDRYYASASASPAAIFGVLLKNMQNHLAKLRKSNPGAEVNHQKRLAEILSKLNDLPTQMPLPEQGLFAIGYYHQTQAFYASKPAAETAAITN